MRLTGREIQPLTDTMTAALTDFRDLGSITKFAMPRRMTPLKAIPTQESSACYTTTIFHKPHFLARVGMAYANTTLSVAPDILAQCHMLIKSA